MLERESYFVIGEYIILNTERFNYSDVFLIVCISVVYVTQVLKVHMNPSTNQMNSTCKAGVMNVCFTIFVVMCAIFFWSRSLKIFSVLCFPDIVEINKILKARTCLTCAKPRQASPINSNFQSHTSPILPNCY